MKECEIEKLREQGYSYTEIASRSKKSRKYVWSKCREVIFSKEGKKRYKEKVRGNINNINPQNIPLSREKMRIIAHLLFDGCVFKSDKYHKISKYVKLPKARP